MIPLILSLVALVLGPLLIPLARRLKGAGAALDAFVLVAIGGFVFLHMLPESLALGGAPAWIAAIVGLFAPLLAERGLLAGNKNTHRIILLLAGLGLAVHAFLDGMAMGDPHTHHHHGAEEPCEHDHTSFLPWAVVLHRIPVSISIWWILPRTLGMVPALVVLLINAASTVAGYSLGSEALTGASQQSLAVFQSLLSGSLLHVVLHTDIPRSASDDGQRYHWPAVIGTALAALILAAISHPGPHGSLAEPFLNLALASAPALLVGYLAVGMVSVFAKTTWLQRATQGPPLTQALRGVALGLPVPVCSCGILPIYRDLVMRGAGSVAAVSFLLATPELEIAAVLLTVSLMGWEFALVRIVAAGLLAVVVGIMVGRGLKSRDDELTDCEKDLYQDDTPQAKGSKLLQVIKLGLGDAVHHTGAWILLGLALSALIHPYLDREAIMNIPQWGQVFMAVLLGLPLYVCASGSTPVAAVLLISGFSPGAVLAFLLTGPATNLATFGILSRLHGTLMALRFGTLVALLALGSGLLVNALIPDMVQVTSSITDSTVGTPLQWACLVVLAAALAWSLLRHGTRSFIEQLFRSPLTLGTSSAHHGHQH